METSKKWSLNSIDINKWIENAFTFIAPLMVIYIGSVINNINDGGFSWDDFEINTIIDGALILYILNVVLDFFRKFLKDNTK